jgi:chromosome partitioning protein
LILPEFELDRLQETERTLSAAFEPGKLSGAPSPTEDYTVIAAGAYEPPDIPDLRWHVPHERVLGEFDLICGDVAMGKYTLPNSADRLQVCKERFMKMVAAARAQYDVVVIDCNPSFSFLTMCAIETCTHTLSPVTPDTFAIRGLYAFRAMIEALYPDLTPDRMILMNRVSRRDPPRQVEVNLRTGARYRASVLSARLAESAYMAPPTGATAPENPLDTLARLRNGPYAAEMHAELDAAALEIAQRVGIAPPGRPVS